jgi:hypothetical protein
MTEEAGTSVCMLGWMMQLTGDHAPVQAPEPGPRQEFRKDDLIAKLQEIEGNPVVIVMDSEYGAFPWEGDFGSSHDQLWLN